MRLVANCYIRLLYFTLLYEETASVGYDVCDVQVASVVGRADVLAALFLLVSFLLYRRSLIYTLKNCYKL